MGLCLADSLLACGGYSGEDLRVRFHNWWFWGYNNSFGNDGRSGSIGLGGNVAKSLAAMIPGRLPPPRFEARTQDSGNGSLMRLAPVPVFYSDNPEMAAQASAESSYSTHPGPIAAAACAFYGFAIAKAINRPEDITPQAFLDDVVKEFRSSRLANCQELDRLLQSAEPRGREQCWNWRAPSLEIESSLRSRGRSYNGYPCTPDYFGSYCIDGLAIALWSFYHTRTFSDAVATCVNFLGDCDTTAAICGQLAGAFYGYDQIDKTLIDRLEQWDDKDTACRGALLFVARQIGGSGAAASKSKH